ncbi:hypothetical protein BD413DRAFT_627354 [Trametes elegans]|nr:hypothetical protein BD413DRAFT_627354 [Trametes elegans]
MEYINLSPSPESSLSNEPPDTHTTNPTNASGGVSEASEPNPTPVAIAMEHPGDATISAAFQPSLRVDERLPDLIVISSNNVYFYAHRHRIANASSNGFGGRFLDDSVSYGHGYLPSIHLPESGDVLNVVLHVMYGLPCTHFHPTLETVEAALDALVKYGVPLQVHAAPYQPLHQLILSLAPYRPVETYAVVGQHALEDLAVPISGHLLSFDLSRITDPLATKMGPVYLKRLFLLHTTRLAALKDILLRPPAAHPRTPGCDPATHGSLTRAWALATAQFVWDASPSEPVFAVDDSPLFETTSSRAAALFSPGISFNSLRAMLEPIGESIVCESCRAMLQQRIQEVVYLWSSVKVCRVLLFPQRCTAKE